MFRRLILGTVFLFSTAAATAQVTVTVGPKPAPSGCPVRITVANDSAQTILIGDGCPYTVQDAFGVTVYSTSCPLFVPIAVQPGLAAEVIPWDQVDNSFNPVAPGLYQMTVSVAGLTFSEFIQVGGTNSGIGLLGSVRPGSNRPLFLCAPAEAGRVYFLGAALSTSTGVPTCGGLFPLDNDILLNFAAMPGNGVFNGFFGVLDANGQSQFPRINMPNDPALSGGVFHLAFVTFDFSSPCVVSEISPALIVTIL